MRVTATERIVPLGAGVLMDHGGFVCLRETAFAEHFHFWRGASARRYAVSVSTIEPSLDRFGAADALPDFDGFVLISVARSGAMRWPLAVVAVERSADRRAAMIEAQAVGASEWHVHLLGQDRAARAAIVADLRARHGRERHALSA